MTLDPRFKEAWEYQIKYWLHYFKESGNPLYAWKVVKAAGLMGWPIPEEVTLYLVNVATDIEKVAENPPLPQKRPLELTKALGLLKKDMGAGSFFNQHSWQQFHRKIATDTYFCIMDECDGVEYPAFEDMANKHNEEYEEYLEKYKKPHNEKNDGEPTLKASKVRRIYREYQKIWEETADHVFEVEAYAVDENNDVYFQVNILDEDKKEAAIVARLIKEKLFNKK